MRKKVDPLVQAMVVQAKNSATNKATDQVIKLLLAIPVMVLHDDFGFGKVRCERFVDGFFRVYDAYTHKYITLEDLMQTLKDEAGVTISKD